MYMSSDFPVFSAHGSIQRLEIGLYVIHIVLSTPITPDVRNKIKFKDILNVQ